ncbi:P-loop NTPase family protein [Brytella acorum]|uniref:ABC transporter ATP-binding protein n=1 Tax=Brytella acorum TaxID=2959299 RepID=A0AA35UH06_9PROT|nr:ABC transporter ATP-binding protein [Brytella acorum]MDF3624286.1 ABC transporter ATP-binding protein [Brytella acorum]CAI9121140.1 ABC transporter ATP-binding protein [Brytella acorum]
MRSTEPVIEMRQARPAFDQAGLMSVAYDLRLMPGDCALIRSRDRERSGLFGDLCAGMVPLYSGTLRCMGLDWTQLEVQEQWALRARIGRIAQIGAWVDMFGTHLNILTPVLHHTTTPEDQLVEEASRLAVRFGLPGLPTVAPGRLSTLDLRRSALVRAFMGDPSLLLLEEPVGPETPELLDTFLGVLTHARNEGTAVIWFARNDDVWNSYLKQATHHFLLLDEGLIPMRGV